MVIAVPLKDIPYVDYPELQIDKHESTEMPFRYVKNADGSPCMPEVSCTRPKLEQPTTVLLNRTGNDGLDQG